VTAFFVSDAVRSFATRTNARADVERVRLFAAPNHYKEQLLAAYVISEVEARDAVLFEQYRSLAPASIAQYGVAILSAAARPKSLKVAHRRRQSSSSEFPTMERAHEWYRSNEYAQALAIRQYALERRLKFVEGV
jgi:uncharacterized protein (DUF1330 family)